MELMVAIGLGVVTACGLYLVLRGRTFPLVLGLSLISYAVNLFILAMGRLVPGASPIIRQEAAGYADPIPQALVLTAIVISFGMTGFLLALAVRMRHQTGSDHVDGVEPKPVGGPAGQS
ncbi:MAG: Na+/H+ antiporter subunit C [Nitrospira sp.]|nr:Na+/H+ antiporter subunit C [Nitrospira sp.]